MEVDTADLESTAETYQEQVSVAVSQDSDLSSYVKMLEERFDSQLDQGPRNLPSGDELAQELEGFLREHRREEELVSTPPTSPTAVSISAACSQALLTRRTVAVLTSEA